MPFKIAGVQPKVLNAEFHFPHFDHCKHSEDYLSHWRQVCSKQVGQSPKIPTPDSHLAHIMTGGEGHAKGHFQI